MHAVAARTAHADLNKQVLSYNNFANIVTRGTDYGSGITKERRRKPRPERTLDWPSVQCKVATTAEEFADVRSLVEQRYAWRGYRTDSGDDRDTQDSLGSNYTTLIAIDGNTTIGTMTLGCDSAAGLRVDEMNHADVDAVRNQGRRVGEIIKLAIDGGPHSRSVLALLFEQTYIMARAVHDLSDIFVEVNPRHVGFYTRLLGFVRAASEKLCPRVNAPSVLLRLEIAELERRTLAAEWEDMEIAA